MPLPRAIARFNRRWTNRFIEPLARRSTGFALIHHVGRRSGRSYTTPVNVFWEDAGTGLVAMTYGPRTDWYQNVASGPASLEHRGVTRRITAHQMVGSEVAAAHIGPMVRFALRILRVRHFCRVSLSPVDTSQ